MKKLIKGSRLLLILAPLFFLGSCMMMPFGQMGMHGANGNQARIDPVCGNQVTGNPVEYEYNNTRYYFDSPGCLSEFQENPGKYAGHHSDTRQHHGSWFLGGLGAGILMTAMLALMFF